MITQLAWRNIWRNPVRSLVVMGAVVIGIWALLSFLGFTQGMIKSYIADAVSQRTSHLQLHDTAFLADKDIRYWWEDGNLVPQLRHDLDVKAVAARTLGQGMVATAKAARGVQIIGINPADEAALTGLDQRVKEGDYLDDEGTNPILIGEKLAQRLHTRLRKKVVLTFQDAAGNQVRAAFRVKGIIQLANAKQEEGLVYVRQSDLNRLLGLPAAAQHEVAILLNETEAVTAFAERLATQVPARLDIAPYYELAPQLALFDEQIGLSTAMMTVIIMLALIFGIINTMLMAVLERTKELGMLMAIGMNRRKVFLTILLETIGLSMLGVPIGVALGALTVALTHRTGINLGQFEAGMDQFGLATMVYPSLDVGTYVSVALSVLVTAVLAAIYPARKAVQLQPMDALRKI